MSKTVNRWDREEYTRKMALVKKLADANNLWIGETLAGTEVDQLVSKYNEVSRLPAAVQSFKESAVKLNDLYRAMEQYLADYEDMLQRAQGKMDNVEEVESAYGSFGDILAEISAVTGTVLASSVAYKFAQSGKTFTGDYNDMTAFMNSDVYGIANGFLGLSNVNNWELYFQTIGSAITGGENEYVSDLLRSGLKSMVESIPGSEPVSFSNLDWDIIGAKLGIENMAEIMKPLDDLLAELSKGAVLTDDDVSSISKVLSVIKETLKSFKGTNALVAMLDGFGGFFKKVGAVDDVVDYASELFANYFNTYADQISYLETMKDSMEAAGYWTGSPLMKEIDELQTLYDEAILKSFDYAMEELKDQAIDIAKEAITKEIPVLNTVDTFFDVASKTSALYGSDRVKAAQGLMGYYQYDNVLTQAYEKYSALVESGAATEAEVAEADRLYAMLHTLKTKEYESMQTISKGYDDAWYNTASEKLEELKRYMPDGADNVSESGGDYNSSIGSSGGGRSGGGRRG